MKFLAATTALVSVASVATAGCEEVRMAEPGWTDLALTSGIAQILLEALGYDANVDQLSIPIIYEAMRSSDMDAFLGYWDPAMVQYYKSYKEDGSVVTVAQNLEGAKFTWAVPSYVYDAGVHDFADLAKYEKEFDAKLYGLSPGSNEIMISARDSDAFGLQDWEVVESSEQGMLAQVERFVKKEDWIAFLAWAPHPMNSKIDLKYLTGGDDFYGPNFGGATVHTQMRKDYMAECPNVGKFLSQLEFTIEMENVGMGYILEDGMSATEAALKVIKADPAMIAPWLDGVSALDGAPALERAEAGLGL
nr:choline ABC transporter substrate-binding protein [Celeribacter sp. HF31]